MRARLSAYLAEEIAAPQKKGLHTEGLRFHGIDNPWLKLFNDRFSGSSSFPFHYTEILAQSFDLKIKAPLPPAQGKIGRIFLQVLTSDTKKNWGLANFRNLLNELYLQYSNLNIKVLASEKEKIFLQNYFESDEICTWDMQTLENELSSSDLLVTGDTVILHLAAQKSTHILELALGSSDPWKTGPYASGHYILSSKVACSPCVHSKPCGQISHLCGENITPKAVKTVIRHIVEQKLDSEKIPILSDSVQVFKSQIQSFGYELVAKNSAKDLRILNKIIWKKIFDPNSTYVSLKPSEFGFTDLDWADWQCELQEKRFLLQYDFENLVQKLGANELALFDIQEVRRKMGSLKVAAVNQEWIWMFVDLAQLSFSTPLHFLSAFQDRLEILKGALFYRDEMTKIKIRGLHESGSGTVSESGLVEA